MEKIAGEIALSDDPGRTLRKWREEMNISVKSLSRQVGVTPSVISDYESGRRRSPGVRTVRRIVRALAQLDEDAGSPYTSRWGSDADDAIPAMAEFDTGVSARRFLASISGKALTKGPSLRREIRGFTIIDSMKAITALGNDYTRIFGYSTERALIFTGVKYGRSPMIVIRTHSLKPAMVVYARPEQVDTLAVQLAELDRVILARTDLDADTIIKKLERWT